MIDLGKKRNDTTGPISPGETSKKNEVYYPDLYINDIDLGLGVADAGKEYTATVKVKVRSISKNVNADGKKNDSITLEIHGIDFGKKPIGKIKDGREHPLQTAIEEGLEEEAKKKEK